jgi:uncharacterized membrane protein YkvA (DUF1232 family)
MQIRDSGFVTLILIMALLYIISPIDVIPDVIPVFGWHLSIILFQPLWYFLMASFPF